MPTTFKPVLLALATILLANCEIERDFACGCGSEAFYVQVLDSSGQYVAIDSIRFALDADTMQVCRGHDQFTSDSTLPMVVGSKAGDYSLWIYAQGELVDSLELSVALDGPEGCVRPVTKSIVVQTGVGVGVLRKVETIGNCSSR